MKLVRSERWYGILFYEGNRYRIGSALLSRSKLRDLDGVWAFGFALVKRGDRWLLHNAERAQYDLTFLRNVRLEGFARDRAGLWLRPDGKFFVSEPIPEE